MATGCSTCMSRGNNNQPTITRRRSVQIASALFAMVTSSSSLLAQNTHASAGVAGQSDSDSGTERVTAGPLRYLQSESWGWREAGAFALADVGVSLAQTYAEYGLAPGFPPAGSAMPSANASFATSDLTITGPGTSVAARLNVQVDGIVGAFSERFANSSFVIHVSLSNLQFAGAAGVAWQFGNGSLSVNGLLEGHVTGTPFQAVAFGTVSTPEVTLPVGIPISLSVSTTCVASAEPLRHVVSAYAIGSSSVSLPVGIPVLDLPPGYTVDSVAGEIVGNLWVGDTYSCVGDLDGDGTVDLSDLSVLLSHFGDPQAAAFDGDLDNDFDVDLSDLALMLARFGSSCP